MNRSRGLKIALSFPELRQHGVEQFADLLRKRTGQLDLVVFPEGFEIIQATGAVRPEDIPGCSAMLDLQGRYVTLAREWDVSVIVGVSVDYGDTSVNGGGNDEFALFASPAGQTIVYHKHSTSLFTAFFDEGWSLERNIRAVGVKDAKIGLSICHDSYISLIPRALRAKGAQVWVNISFQNVRPHMWEAVLQARARENDMFAVCTLHRNSRPGKGQGRPQKEPYAFCPRGKIRLMELETDIWLDEIPEGDRAGRLFYFDTSSYGVLPPSTAEATTLPDGADVMSLSLDDTGVLDASSTAGDFPIRQIDLQTFIRAPERIWKEMLQVRPKVPLFIVCVGGDHEWQRFSSEVAAVIRARVIEFSTLFLFTACQGERIYMGAYRSSSYKDTRVFYPQRFPVSIDRRYLKGLESTYNISLCDARGKNSSIYFERVRQLIGFLDSGTMGTRTN